MGRIRKEANRYWSKEEKLRIIKRVMEDDLSTGFVANEEDISGGMLRGWIIKYNEFGENALENKKKPGNPLSKYNKRKQLSDLEKLEFENMKLRIENERLKKGYIVKGDGPQKIFISINKKNLK